MILDVLYLLSFVSVYRFIANLKSFRHDAAHNGTHSECALHIQFAQRRFELVDGNQPGSNGRRGCAEQI